MKKIFFIALYIFTVTGIWAQDDFKPGETNILPPAPNAAELGKFGFMTTGMHTGSASASIPIFELNSKELSLPISLSYNSNGIKVDQIASNVGLGWVLNAGGVITPIVRNQPGFHHT